MFVLGDILENKKPLKIDCIYVSEQTKYHLIKHKELYLLHFQGH